MLRGLPVLAFALALAAPAGAQPRCFRPGEGEAERGPQVAGIADPLRLEPGCEYALASGGPWRSLPALTGRTTDFLEVFQTLASEAAPPDGDPRVVLGRPRGRPDAPQQSVLLRYCEHFLLEEQLGLAAIPEGRGFRIDRTDDRTCGADRIEVRAVRGADYPGLATVTGEAVLGVDDRSLALPFGEWTLFAARPGGPVGLRIGVFRAQRAVTPLQNHLRRARASDAAPSPLVEARWAPGSPGLVLTPTDRTLQQDLLWPELRTASEAGFLWLATAEEHPRVVTPLRLEAGGPGALRLPDSVVRDAMVARYGEAGRSLAPTGADWRRVLGALRLCLTPSYQDGRTAARGEQVPDPGMCAALGALTSLDGAASGGSAGQLCLAPGMQVMRASGAGRRDEGEEACDPLPAPGASGAVPRRITVVGDRVRLVGEDLCVLLDNQPLAPAEGEAEGTFLLSRSGLLEVRRGGGPGCAATQALGLARLPVLDPEREWHPVGLAVGADPAAMSCADGGFCPWAALAHDEEDVFAFVRNRHRLTFRFSTSPAVAAVLEAAGDVQATSETPLLSGVEGSFEGAPPAAVVAYAARGDRCPAGPDATLETLRARVPPRVEAQLPGTGFSIFLLGVQALDEPVRCLARARFRVRPARALFSTTEAGFVGLELGLLGDTRLAFFFTEPFALGVVLPAFWFRLSLQPWAALDVSGNAVLAGAFDPEALSRVGVSLSASLALGIPEVLPRIVDVGVMVHGAARTHPTNNPVVSGYVALNLSSLIDLAGGR
ncbi:MAG: hypothetical protein ACFCGT_18680 [Sandaracinaceae bacterium]